MGGAGVTGKPSLRTRAISAGLWTVGGQVSAQLLRLISNLVMTRLLAPDAFGVMAVAWTITSAIGMFSDIGLGQSVMRSRRGEDPRFLNTIWTVKIYRAAVISLVALAFAGVLAVAGHLQWLPATVTYAHPDLPEILAGISLAILIGGFRSVKFLTAGRNFALGRIIIIELVSQIIGLAAMLAWALLSPSVFALVGGAVISSVVSVVAGQYFLPGAADRFAWEPEALREIRDFGRWIMVTSGLGFFGRVGDSLLMGWLLSASSMGLYSIASMMAGVPQLILNKLMGTVGLPSLAEVYRQDPGRLRGLYYQIRRPVDAFCLVTAGTLYVAGDSIVRLLYDVRYANAGAMLEVLSLVLFASRYGITSQFCLVLGKPKMMAYLTAMRIGTMVLAVPIGHALAGPIGAVWGVALAPTLELIWTVFVYQRRLGIFDARRELAALLFMPAGMALGWGLSWAFGALGLF